MSNCPDCGVRKGSLHILGCDMETCPDCGGQYISCGCNDNYPRIKQAGKTPEEEITEHKYYQKYIKIKNTRK